MKRIKDKLYYYFAEKNWGVRREYGPYVDAHQNEHAKSPWKHWWLLIRLNWHYRICKKEDYLIGNFNFAATCQPYYGIESEMLHRTQAQRLAKAMLKYDVISFDVFDTLLLRHLDSPRDVFSLVGEKLGCINFPEIRFNAEKQARKLKEVTQGNTEVTIWDIYQQVEQRTGINIEVGVRTEFKIEMDMCFPNPYMQRVYQILKAKGKRLIATSDMYYPQEMMKELLNHCGFNQFDTILVSCDYMCSKHNGILYKHLKDRVSQEEKLIHIGDNLKADMQQADSAGIDTYYYKKCSEAGRPYRPTTMSSMIGAAYKGIINTTIHNGCLHMSAPYEYGFIYGGLFVLGYVCWIHEQAKKEKLEKILFLARDGFIYKKVYDKLFSDIPSEYVFWSRAVSLKFGFLYNMDDFLTRMVDHKANKGNTIEDVLKILDLSDMCGVGDLLEAEGIKKTDKIHDGNKKCFELFFIHNRKLISKELIRCEQGYKTYFDTIIRDAKRVGIIDTGWRGDNQLILRNVLTERWSMVEEAICYMAGSITKERNADYRLHEKLCCYMFSENFNTQLYGQFKKNAPANMALFELFSQADHPSFLGLSLDGKFRFGYAEAENIPLIRQILRGEYDFCMKYVNAFKDYPVLFSISGSDAFMPFKNLINNYEVAKMLVGDICFEQTIGTKDGSRCKTMSEILDGYVL